ERPIALELDEVGGQLADVIEGVGPIRVLGELQLLPRGQLRVVLALQLRSPGLEPCDLLGHVLVATREQQLELADLAFELDDRLFKVEDSRAHGCASPCDPRNCPTRSTGQAAAWSMWTMRSICMRSRN